MIKSRNYSIWQLALILGCLFAGRIDLLYATETQILSDNGLVISGEFSGPTQNGLPPSSTPSEDLTKGGEGSFVTTTIPGTSPSPNLVVGDEVSFRTTPGAAVPTGQLVVSDEGSFQTSNQPSGGGGGGGDGDNNSGGNGGGGRGGGRRRPPTSVTPNATSVASPQTCGLYLLKFIKFGAANDPNEVRKLQTFLRDEEGFRDLLVTGFYDAVTFRAVMVFQTRYQDAILKPWGINYPTGYVYITTTLAINNLHCNRDPANDLDLRIRTREVVLPPVATTTATSTLPEVGLERSGNFFQLAALGLLDFIKNHPWWWAIFCLFLILILFLSKIFEKKRPDDGENDG